MRKRIIILILLILIIPFNVNANKRVGVELEKCVDGDTARFMLNGERITVRFLAIDTPETKHPTKGEEPFGKEASEYTCNALTKANTIILEYDDGSYKDDKYGRHLAWIFVDDTLLQKELVEKGYAKVAYLYGDYKYTEELQKLERVAQSNQVGLWGDYVAPPDYTLYYIIGGITLILVLTFVLPRLNNKEIKSMVRKSNTKIKKSVTKDIKKMLK